jgi:hypothetical protein
MSAPDRPQVLDLMRRLQESPLGPHLVLGGSSGVYGVSEAIPAFTEDVDVLVDDEYIVTLMAVYFNMVVDCGESEALAERIQQHFTGYVLDLSPLAPVDCITCGGRFLERWYAGVQPRGVGYGTLPESERRRELTSKANLARIRELLYGHLAEIEEIDGYERAYFGGDPWYTYAEAGDVNEDPWAPDMIIAERLVAGRFPRADFVPFAPGYLRWLPRVPIFELPAGWVRDPGDVSGWYIAKGTVPGEAGAARFQYAWGAGMWQAGLPVLFPHHRAESFDSTTAPLRSEDLSTPDLRITLFEVAGTFKPMPFEEAPAAPRPLWRVLHAFVEAPGSGWEWFFEVIGPDTTVAAARAPFVRMLRGVRRDRAARRPHLLRCMLPARTPADCCSRS